MTTQPVDPDDIRVGDKVRYVTRTECCVTYIGTTRIVVQLEGDDGPSERHVAMHAVEWEMVSRANPCQTDQKESKS